MNKKSFIQFTDLVSKTKTKVIEVSSDSGIPLGVIKFWGAWRQYTFQPASNTVLNVDCMKEIIDKVDSLNAEIRAEWAARRKQTRKCCIGFIH